MAGLDPQYFATHPRLVHCTVESRTIFLDLSANRYFALPPALEAAFTIIARTGSTEGLGGPEIQSLLRAKLISADGATTSKPCSSILPVQLELDRFGMPAKASLAALSLFGQVTASIRLRRRSLMWLPARLALSRRKLEASVVAPERWAPIARAFDATRLWRWRADHCLTSSIAFIETGLRHSFDAELVFGVRSTPFAAHCWVQSGGVVLNDRIENVRPYSPILAI